MNATFDVLLLELLKREDALPTSPAWHGATGTYRERVQQAYAHNQQLREAEVGPAWSSCEWFGALRAADRMSWSRLLKRAEATGLIEVFRPGGLAKNLKLTAAGRTAAEALSSKRQRCRTASPEVAEPGCPREADGE
jgi:hypothetical protein